MANLAAAIDIAGGQARAEQLAAEQTRRAKAALEGLPIVDDEALRSLVALADGILIRSR